MHIGALVEMVESGLGERVLVGTASSGLTGEQVAQLARRAGAELRETCGSLVYAGENHPRLPIAMLGAAWAGVPFVPVNYRLQDDQLVQLIDRQPGCKVLADPSTGVRLRDHHVEAADFESWLLSLPDVGASEAPDDDNEVAIVLYTSGTTSAPKAAFLRHRHLMAYLLGTVEYASAGEDEAVLVAVPPYHIAGMANMLSNLFAGRRLVYIDHFDADTWLKVARDEGVTHAMVVPTMLSRIVDAISAGNEPPTTLRSLSYGGSKISPRVLESARWSRSRALGSSTRTASQRPRRRLRSSDPTTTERPSRRPIRTSGAGLARRGGLCLPWRRRSATRTATCWSPGKPAPCTCAANRSQGSTRRAACSTATGGFARVTSRP